MIFIGKKLYEVQENMEKEDMYRHKIIFNELKKKIQSYDCVDILDIGWGFGTIFNMTKKEFSKNRLNLFACDFNLTDLAKKRSEYVTFNICYLPDQKIPFNKKFDIILLCEVLEHLNFSKTSINQFLNELKKHLKGGGVLICSTPHIASSKNIIKLILNKNINDKWNNSFIDGRKKMNRTPHIREFTIPELKELFEANGFEIKKIITIYRPTTQWFMRLPFNRFKDDVTMILKKNE